MTYSMHMCTMIHPMLLMIHLKCNILCNTTEHPIVKDEASPSVHYQLNVGCQSSRNYCISPWKVCRFFLFYFTKPPVQTLQTRAEICHVLVQKAQLDTAYIYRTDNLDKVHMGFELILWWYLSFNSIHDTSFESNDYFINQEMCQM